MARDTRGLRRDGQSNGAFPDYGLAVERHLVPAVSAGPRHLQVIVALGFPSRFPPGDGLPQEVSSTIQMAGLATWCVREVRRLRSELGVVNDRLGKRKLVERAKGLLQTESGLNEPQAYEYLRKLSRQRRIRMEDIAKDLLETSDAGRTDSSP